MQGTSIRPPSNPGGDRFVRVHFIDSSAYRDARQLLALSNPVHCHHAEPTISWAAGEQLNVLDIDLDLFVSNPVFRLEDSGRADDSRTEPWTEPALRAFLENQCHLSTERPMPGRVGCHHDEAYDFWAQLIRSDQLTAPFDVVHADAHSDLGWGPAGWTHLLVDHLACSVEDRHPPVRGDRHLHYGNYLAYAVANRWISAITWVYHEKQRAESFDILFRNFDSASGFLELPYCREAALSTWIGNRGRPKTNGAIGCEKREPPVPFRMVPSSDYNARRQFDFIFVAKSPGYTPPQSDKLIPILEEYIEAI